MKLPEQGSPDEEDGSGDQEESPRSGGTEGAAGEEGALEEEGQPGDTENEESGKDKDSSALHNTSENQDVVGELDVDEDFTCEETEEAGESLENDGRESAAEPSVSHTDGEKEECGESQEQPEEAAHSDTLGSEHYEKDEQESPPENEEEEDKGGDDRGNDGASEQELQTAMKSKKEMSRSCAGGSACTLLRKRHFSPLHGRSAGQGIHRVRLSAVRRLMQSLTARAARCLPGCSICFCLHERLGGSKFDQNGGCSRALAVVLRSRGALARRGFHN